MLEINKGTENKLIVISNPQCAICREIQKSNRCDEIPLTRKLILVPFNSTDEELIKIIFKAYEPLKVYKKILNGEQPNSNEINWTKDITKDWIENKATFDFIAKNFEIKGTPAFFVMNKNGELLKEITLEMEPVDVLMFNLRDFF